MSNDLSPLSGPVDASGEPADVREPMETWLRQLEGWAVRERDGDDVCRWCAVNRGFHYRGCPIEALVVGVRTYVTALRRSGLIEIPPMLSLQTRAAATVPSSPAQEQEEAESRIPTHFSGNTPKQAAISEEQPQWITLPTESNGNVLVNVAALPPSSPVADSSPTIQADMKMLHHQIGRVRAALRREDSQRAETLFQAASGLCISAADLLRLLEASAPSPSAGANTE